jgi:hypothetical protein
MKLKEAKIKSCSDLNIASVAQVIADLQEKSGDIPWHCDGKTDPWDLVESAMGLNVGGLFRESNAAFQWLKINQNSEGSWYSSYINGHPENRTCETHMSSYIATGLFHTWLTNKDSAFLEDMWMTMEKGVDFAISFQTPGGEIYWAKSPEGVVDPMSLLSGSSSIFMSLKCAIAICAILGKRKKSWEIAFKKLGASIRENLHNYNVSKARYSMYWFYPILSGAIQGENAKHRIEKYWSKYMIEGQGARCVSDEPWVTIAETSELVLALNSMGNVELANIVFSWIRERVYEDNTFWCGYTYPDMVIWPEEKISWTNAVVLMAADALFNLTPASRLFNHSSWEGFVYTDLEN